MTDASGEPFGDTREVDDEEDEVEREPEHVLTIRNGSYFEFDPRNPSEAVPY